MDSKFRDAASSLHLFLGEISDPDELAQRARIWNLRDVATHRATYVYDDQARDLAWMIVELASAWVFRPGAALKLKLVADQGTRLLHCADVFEQVLARSEGDDVHHAR